MEILTNLISYILEIDQKLGPVIQTYGGWTYAILFLIIFLETGLVVTPFLPGDSLLFAVGAFAARGFLDPLSLFGLLSLAAVLGDAVNYFIGRRVSSAVFERDRPFVNEDYLKRTQDFYQKHGKKTIILARFIPIIRTFAPFIAGVGKMRYENFAVYNIIGGLLWVSLTVFGGYFFGNIPIVRDNFEIAIIAIIAISLIPAVIEFWKHRSQKLKIATAKVGVPPSKNLENGGGKN
ncbi:MAG: DedA family protein [Patescibacteria group bacterium]